MNRKSLIFIASALLASTAAAQAAGGVSLVASVAQEQVVQENGRSITKLIPAARVSPGDDVVYVLSYANGGTKRADNVVITNPIPANLAFVGAEGAVVSVDGGTSYGPLAELRLPGADGSSRLATAADVTHVRWTLAPIAPGSKGEVTYRARLK